MELVGLGNTRILINYAQKVSSILIPYRFDMEFALQMHVLGKNLA